MPCVRSPSTFFHLVPENEEAGELLYLSENKNFVSRARSGDIGIEIGFHVSRVPGCVMARLGRGLSADLFLPGEDISSIHIAFELHPETKVVLLSVRAKNTSSVTVQTCTESCGESEDEAESHGDTEDEDVEQVGGEVVEGDCVLVYGQEYIVKICAYKFRIVWLYRTNWKDFVEEFRKIVKRGELVRSRDRPTVDNSACHTWHNTRIYTANRVLFREAPGASRKKLGAGGFGSVYQAADFESGQPFAIKVITLKNPTKGNIDAYAHSDYERSLVHKEIKMLAKLKHRNVIELLGYDKLDTRKPEIFMPIRPGSVFDLKKADKSANGTGHQKICGDEFCSLLLEQILSALDYMVSMKVFHRDIKPANILYHKTGDRIRDYVFQLADFGQSKNQTSILNWAGTIIYMAPEAWQCTSNQLYKADVWSLFATIVDVCPDFEEFPPNCPAFLPPQAQYSEAVTAIQRAAGRFEKLAPMARMDPDERASAAQLLLTLFDGRGLTTPRNKIPPLVAQLTPYASPSLDLPDPVSAIPSSSLLSSADTRVLAATLRPRRSRPLLQYLRPRPGRSGASAGGISARGGISKPVAQAGPAQRARRVPVKLQVIPEAGPQEGTTN